MVSKPYVCENDETTKDTKAGDDEVEEWVWVLGELKSAFINRGSHPLYDLSEQSWVTGEDDNCLQKTLVWVSLLITLLSAD